MVDAVGAVDAADYVTGEEGSNGHSLPRPTMNSSPHSLPVRGEEDVPGVNGESVVTDGLVAVLMFEMRSL